MKKLIRSISILSLNFICFLPSAFANNPNQLEDEMNVVVAQTIHRMDMHPNSVWPGFSLSNMPVVLWYNDTDHVYAYHFTPIRSEWQLRNIENMPVYFFPKNILDKTVYGPYYDNIENQYSLVHTPAPYSVFDVQSNVAFLIGYHFWNTYRLNIPDITWMMYRDSEYDSFNQIENIKLAYLATEAMKTYLQTKDLNALKDYVAVENHRFDISNSQSRRFELARDSIFGLDHFIGLKSLGLSDADFVQKIFDRLEDSTVTSPIGILENMKYSRSLFIMNALGYVLDKIYPEWIHDFIPLQGHITLHQVLTKKLQMNLREQLARLENAKNHYHYDVISHDVDKVMQPYLADMKTQLDMYNKAPGVELQYGSICLSLVVFGDADFYQGSRDIYKNFNDHENCTNQRGGFNSLNLRQIPLFIRDYSWNYSSLNKFKIADDTEIQINGSKDTAGEFVAAHKTSTFNKLVIKNPSVNIEVNEPGVIDGSSGALEFKLTSIDLNKQKADYKMAIANNYFKHFQHPTAKYNERK